MESEKVLVSCLSSETKRKPFENFRLLFSKGVETLLRYTRNHVEVIAKVCNQQRNCISGCRCSGGSDRIQMYVCLCFTVKFSFLGGFGVILS